MRKKVIIIGGVAAGASAAARLRRLDENAEIIMLEKGEHISFASCGLPYYVGGVIEQRKNLLVQTPAAMNKRFALDVRTGSEATAIDTKVKTVTIEDKNTGRIYQETYDYLILCTGASPIIPDTPGLDKKNVFLVRNIPDSDMVRAYVQSRRCQSAAVIGGGLIGLEMTEMLRRLNIEVHLIEASPQVLPSLDPDMASYVHRELRNNQVKLHLQDKAQALLGDEYVSQIQLESGLVIDADLVILGIGVRPETTLAKQAGLKLGLTRGIEVDEYLCTSDPYIYAAGDAIQVNHMVSGQETLFPLAGPANRQGWIAANNICGEKITYKGVQGTSIIKIINQTAAATGLNEKTLKNLGTPYEAVHIHPNSHATYYPGAAQMAVKILFSPQSGTLLGAQIVGPDGVDKRIDVLATALRAKMNVFDLQELELAYAPPYSSAKDPVNMAAYAAGNIVKGYMEVIHWEQVPAFMENQPAFLLDTRTPKEYSLGSVPGAFNLPVDEIRARYAELPKDQTILVYCQAGLRSYIATRILIQLGFKVKNISGGYNLYSTIHSEALQ